jgi:flavin-dependent dehydrogenase
MIKKTSGQKRYVDSKGPKLTNGDKVAVIGGGPAGSFFAHFLLDLSRRVDLDIEVDIFEPKNFSVFGPKGCNHCGGIVSESLVQILAAEGIILPTRVVRRGINAYVLHTDVGMVRINTPDPEKRIAAMFRGAGPTGTEEVKWASFDGFLQQLTQKSGANIRHEIVQRISIGEDGKPLIKTRKAEAQVYDLVVGAGGVSASFLRLFEKLDFGFNAPETTKTSICEFFMTEKLVHKYFGDAMHVFLLNIPRLKFAALIPKGDFVTLALLGDKIDKNLLQAFLQAPEVKNCFPEDWDDLSARFPCMCFPSINVKSAERPFTDRVILIGDSATSKLYKNGIGAAYITAKAAATTAVFEGISTADFRKNYWPACKYLEDDNWIGRQIFNSIRIIQKLPALKKGILFQVEKEALKKGKSRHLSMILWDTFTGSAPYREILLRALKPSFIFSFMWQVIRSIFNKQDPFLNLDIPSSQDQRLGKVFSNRQNIINQGEVSDNMYVIQSGQVEVIQELNGKEVLLTKLEEGDFFGEMALFDDGVRSTTVRARGEVRVLTVDRKTLMRKIQEDPSLAFRMLQRMSSRIRELDSQFSDLKVS